jgi:hypothetical protein
VQAIDAHGNPVPTYSGIVHFSSSDPQALLPPDQVLTGGNGSFVGALYTTGNQTITVTDRYDNVIAGSGEITIYPRGASHFVVSAPSTAGTGISFPITVTAVDAYGNVVPSYDGVVHFTSTDSGAALPLDTYFDNHSSGPGVSTYTVILNTAGPQSITASDANLPVLTGTSNSIATNGGAPPPPL